MSCVSCREADGGEPEAAEAGRAGFHAKDGTGHIISASIAESDSYLLQGLTSADVTHTVDFGLGGRAPRYRAAYL